ncbi:hypothetical protein P154DRAFT_280149 [Amniculicola lignicola CBS 123094]|uniref:Uncharacterized protein n=1 Tax=Amniculicola lignicola CBS 123094 TaxID=1392246 RepID=A0A6A5WIR9_9PLEO|nr:hypothetical protein P154DRAFT_280149 [Amniculicola lignicola CBS 123094]
MPAAYFETLEDVGTMPESVNLQGVRHFGPDDPLDYVAEHCPQMRIKKVRWVNDDSLNYECAGLQDAAELRHALTDEDAGFKSADLPAQTSRPAKPYSKQPDCPLQVREANAGDRKQKRAADRSAFYKTNPQTRTERGRLDLDYDGAAHGSSPQYDESMYDDPPARPLRFDSDRRSANRRSENRGSETRYTESRRDNDRGRSAQNRERNGDAWRHTESRRENDRDRSAHTRERRGDTWRRRPERSGRAHDAPQRPCADCCSPEEPRYGRLRGRSASPEPEEDGRLGFDEHGSSLRRRYRSRSRERNIRRQRSPSNDPDDRFYSNKLIEARPRSAERRSHSFAHESDDFGERMRAAREPFPHKTEISNHRRTDAHDESAYSRRGSSSLLARMTDKSGRPIVESAPPSKGSLLSRMEFTNSDDDDDDFNIRGIGRTRNAGFSIRGAAGGA